MVRVLIASDGWTTPGTAMHGYARDVLESVRRAGVDATAGPLENFTDGRAFGGTLGPVARCLFAGYDNPEHRLVHNTGWPPNGRRGAAVVTFHDLYAFHDPDRWAFLRRAAYRAMARRARTVVAETAFIAGEIGRFLGRPVAQRTVVVPIPFEAPRELPNAAKEFDALWVGVDSPRKGLAYFLEETRKFPDLSVAVRWSQIRGAHPLPEVAAALEASRRPHLVEISGKLSEAELDLLYARSRCVVSTSTYEGFHMPMMEAYLRGIRIVVPAEEPYRALYGDSEGVHYYERTPGRGRSIGDAVREAAGAPAFTPSERVRRAVSFETVGAALRAVYEASGSR